MHIEEKNLESIERFLTQSMNGIHLLFDRDSVAEILSTPTEEIDFFTFERMDRIQKLFSEFVKRESFVSKKLFLESLDPDSYEILVRTYFHIVDNTLAASVPSKH